MRSKTGLVLRSFTIFVSFLAGLAIAPARGQALNPDPPASTVKLIFIHHSTGEGWLSDDLGRLGIVLTDNNYFVSDTNYGWGADMGSDKIGDHTDIGNWYDWFLGPSHTTYCSDLYAESGNNSGYTRMADADDPGGANEIVMFKSCFPNSAIYGNPGDAPLPKGQTNPIYGQSAGDSSYTVANIKGLYRDLLDYFSNHQDKLFILIVSPPLIQSETTAGQAANARAVANWLVTSWLSSYPYANVKVFDYFNVLTSNGGSRTVNDAGKTNGNHHRYWDSVIQHLQTVAGNYSAYGSGDSHPTGAGQKKATAEFVPLLNIWYNGWKNVPPSTLTVTAPISGDTWYTRSPVTITWVKSGGQDSSVKIQLYKGTTKVLDISRSTPNDESFDWTVAPTLAAGAAYHVRVTTLDGRIQDDSDVFAVARPTIIVSAPARAAVWNKGTPQSITWVKSGPQDANVKVQLLRSGTKVLDIALSAPNSESCDWTVPSSLPNSTAYKVRVKTLDNAVTGLSPVFTIR